MSEARIECVVGRPFFHRGLKYCIGDIFWMNPNDIYHNDWIRNRRIYELQEDAYEYVFLKNEREFFGKFYSYGDIFELEDIEPSKLRLFIKRGYLKKQIKKSTTKDFSYNEYAKTKDIKYKELKELYKERFDEYLPHHAIKVDNDIYQKLELMFPKDGIKFQDLCNELNIAFEQLSDFCKDNLDIIIELPEEEISQKQVKEIKESIGK